MAFRHCFEQTALRLRRRAINFIGQDHVGENGTGLEFEARTFGGIAHTHDLAEGTKAFLEKRKPHFTGN